MSRKLSRWTQLVQPDFSQKTSLKSLTTPVERASTVVFDTVEKLRKRDWLDKNQYTYGLLGTPTTRKLEEQLAMIDGVPHAMLLPSGLSAISTTLLALLKSGDRVLMPSNSYEPGLTFLRSLQSQFHVELDFYDPAHPENLVIKENTKLLWIETPGSVTMEVADLPALAKIAHAHGVLVAIDATWAAGIALPAFELGADIVIQALTKYQSGGSDVMMGSITVESDSIYQQLREMQIKLGLGVSPEDCHLILRSLPHYPLRYRVQDQSARTIAAKLQQQPLIEAVLHPALPGAPGHNIWARDFSAAASLFSIVFKPEITQVQIDRFVESLQLFHLGFSWGGAVSLAIPYLRNQMHAGYAYEGCLVRFYIGLEDTQDLITDLEQAFQTLDN
ncbi:aminotransferase class I/II-fold pyridoxal phosphate-dependent enzyme [Methyloradius palustris]|uniref:Cystathionine beta-lyase n=1 Tax=Methyloradius palustris TaxID=2778876 RepID=A0A8D5G074_9PROT|nr:aminotransferase class I/II-fold pyridoxal phosphate-dependent enzyme [Methyloradius palustris]BCM23753.1 cystathionine beta-lyase [Methyloradius palustris]